MELDVNLVIEKLIKEISELKFKNVMLEVELEQQKGLLQEVAKDEEK